MKSKLLNIDIEIRKTSSGHTQFLSEVYEHIEKHLSYSEYQIKDLCNHLNMSRLQIYRKLRKSIDTTFTEILINSRIQKAAYFLKHTDLHISEIARSVGIKDPSYFTKIFKNRMGITPKQFRNNHAHHF